MADGTSGPRVWRFGTCELDEGARTLRRNGRIVRLQDKPFELLLALVERAGVIVTRDELRRRLWPTDTFVAFDEGLNAAVRKVRQALNDSHESPRFIETVPRHGYRFVAPVHVGQPGGAEPAAHALTPPRATSGRSGTARIAWAVPLVIVAAALIDGVARRAPDPPSGRFEIAAPPDTYFPAEMPRAVVSPDGRHIAFLAGFRARGVHQLWIRRLDGDQSYPVDGTDHAFHPFWSPRSDALAFISYSKLRRLDLASGQIVTLADAAHSGAGTWNARDEILFTTPGGLARISGKGGAVEQVTRLDTARGEVAHDWPHFMPDGRSFTFTIRTSGESRVALYFGRLDGAPPVLLLNAVSRAQYVAGMLGYVRDGVLYVQPFDSKRAAFVGPPMALVEGVSYVPETGNATFSFATSPLLVYARHARGTPAQLVWRDRHGKRRAVVGRTDYWGPLSLSRDGQWIAVQRRDPETGAPDVWVVENASGTARRLTSNPANDRHPVWAPDTARVAYARQRAIRYVYDLALARRDGHDTEMMIHAADVSDSPSDWSPRGDTLLFTRTQIDDLDIWRLSVDGGEAQPWLITPAREWQAQFSPDGRWVAYTSDQTGRPEIYVRPSSGDDPAWQVSRDGGGAPRWSDSGRELFYISAERRLMSVPVATGAVFSAGEPLALMDVERRAPANYPDTAYAVAPDAQSFLFVESIDEPRDPPLVVVVNWRRLFANPGTPSLPSHTAY
jgi:eukaryotic-like serine/threonine-protein kinase